MKQLTPGDWLKIAGLILGLAGTILSGYIRLLDADHQLERRVDRLEYMNGIVTDGDT